MKDAWITFRSITPAQRGEELFRKAGISCRLQRTPAQMTDRGCSYGLRLNRARLAYGIEVLRRNQVPFRKTYLVNPEGTPEEVML